MCGWRYACSLYFPCVGDICKDAAMSAVRLDRRKKGQTTSALVIELWNMWSRQLLVKNFLLGKVPAMGGRTHCSNTVNGKLLWVQSVGRRWISLTLQGQWEVAPIDMTHMPRAMFPFLCPSLRLVLAVHSGLFPSHQAPVLCLRCPSSLPSRCGQTEASSWHSQSGSLGACSGARCLGPIVIGRGVSEPWSHLLSGEIPA